ncbi:MAG: nucleotidyltransferase domain-containing protein [Flavobacterium sp.]|jgi:predicted nucleotidyltransferase|nr:nucleotidyltransferase domain-containing protein [Flavobacterium sp.]
MQIKGVIDSQLLESLSKQFKKLLKDYYGERLVKVILYGSYARGNPNADSDIDFLVVLKDNKISKFAEIEAITEQVFAWLLNNNLDISYTPISNFDFENAQTPFLYFVRAEGITI